MYQGGGLRISESVNQEGMNLESCSCNFFFEGEWCNVVAGTFFCNHKYNCEVNLWEGAFWREHAHIEKQRFGMVRGWTVLLTPGLAVKNLGVIPIHVTLRYEFIYYIKSGFWSPIKQHLRFDRLQGNSPISMQNPPLKNHRGYSFVHPPFRRGLVAKSVRKNSLLCKEFPGTLNNNFLLDVCWSNHFLCKDLESSNWNKR